MIIYGRIHFHQNTFYDQFSYILSIKNDSFYYKVVVYTTTFHDQKFILFQMKIYKIKLNIHAYDNF